MRNPKLLRGAGVGVSAVAIAAAGVLTACDHDHHSQCDDPGIACDDHGSVLVYAPYIVPAYGIFGTPGYHSAVTIQPGAPNYHTTYINQPPNYETGADAIAKAWTESHRGPTLDLEEHRANWGECRPSCYHKPRWRDGEWYCPAAGPYRNQEMVDAGADICLGFPLGESHGTRDCMGRAREANIPVVDLSAPVRTGS